MDKIGIIGNGAPCLLIAKMNDRDVTDEEILRIAEEHNVPSDRIEFVDEADFIARSKELSNNYTIIQSHTPPVPDIHFDDISFEKDRRTKVRQYMESDFVGYCKKIGKRRKRNKNKKTHRK